MKSGVEPLHLTTFTYMDFYLFVFLPPLPTLIFLSMSVVIFEKKLMIVCLTNLNGEHVYLEGSALHQIVTSYL